MSENTIEKNIQIPSINALRWQCRRGMLELDLILLPFFEHQYEVLSDDQKKVFVELLQESDQTLFDCFIKKVPHSNHFIQTLIEKILKKEC